MKNIVFLLMSLMLYGCSGSDKQKTVTEFMVSGDLTAEVVSVPVPYLVPRYMGISGDYLFVYKEREENLFSLFSLPDLEHLATVGQRGKGPHDFNLLDTRSFQITPDGFHVIDANLNARKEVEIDRESLKVKSSKQIFGQGLASNGFYPMGKGRYVTFTQPDSDKEYVLYDESTGDFSLVDIEYPHWQDIPKEIPAFMTYARTCVPHPDGKRFAAFYSRFKRWRLFDASLNLISEVDVRIVPYEADAALEVAEQPIYYIGQPYATDEYIYVLCSNKNTSKDGRSELQVWDWEGNAVACYTFDRRLSLMAICEKYGKIYAIDNQVEDQMFVYDLPKNDKQMNKLN